MHLTDAIVEAWDRQSRIVTLIADRIDDQNKFDKPSADGEPVYVHLAHMHETRKFHMDQLDAARSKALPSLGSGGWHGFTEDLSILRSALDESALAVRAVMKEALASGQGNSGGYDHPVFFLQHLIWHEGWHAGLIFLALRRCGHEIPEEWEEANVWAQWRTD